MYSVCSDRGFEFTHTQPAYSLPVDPSTETHSGRTSLTAAKGPGCCSEDSASTRNPIPHRSTDATNSPSVKNCLLITYLGNVRNTCIDLIMHVFIFGLKRAGFGVRISSDVRQRGVTFICSGMLPLWITLPDYCSEKCAIPRGFRGWYRMDRRDILYGHRRSLVYESLIPPTFPLLPL